jgi:hypothetical protein
MKSRGRTLQKNENGQILVIMALIFIGLVAIIGLVVDAGYMYVSYSRLRRAVDAAALSATMQYKKSVPVAKLRLAAREFLVLNGVPNTNSLSAEVDTCVTLPSLCPGQLRKLVKVTAREDVPLFFMSVLGISSIPIEVTSISEAATVDLVLVIDRSESMGYYKDQAASIEWPKPSINLDPKSCNTSPPDGSPPPGVWQGNCHPYQEVKEAAYAFVDTFMDADFDRVAIVVFDNVPHPVNFGTAASPVYLSSNRGVILEAIRKLWMYDGFPSGSTQDNRSPIKYPYDNAPFCSHFLNQTDIITGLPVDPPADFSPCRLKTWDEVNKIETDLYERIDYPGYYTVLNGGDLDLTKTGSTNIGGGLFWAANIFSTQGRREGALWVTVLLTDGVPNAAYDDAGNPICPDPKHYPRCIDTDANVRHYFEDPGHTIGASDVIDPNLYDADDYARDQADALAEGSLIFAIGLGNRVTATDFGTPPVGSTLLEYIASVGGTDSYYQGNVSDLQDIFLAIANKIATRLTQ